MRRMATREEDALRGLRAIVRPAGTGLVTFGPRPAGIGNVVTDARISIDQGKIDDAGEWD